MCVDELNKGLDAGELVRKMWRCFLTYKDFCGG